jgi:hypothetical protein
MALPGREKTFALENCRDLHRKLEREIKRFGDADPDDVEARIDLAFNIVVTAWHLCDWVFADLTPAQKSSLQITSLSALQDIARVQCRALHLCRQVAVASKHWKVTDHPDPDVAVMVTATPQGTTAARSPVPLHLAASWYLYFVDGPNMQEAEEVFDSALTFWTQFIYPNKIAEC